MKTFLTKAQRKELMDEYLECLWHVDEDFTFEKEAETIEWLNTLDNVRFAEEMEAQVPDIFAGAYDTTSTVVWSATTTKQ